MTRWAALPRPLLGLIKGFVKDWSRVVRRCEICLAGPFFTHKNCETKKKCVQHSPNWLDLVCRTWRGVPASQERICPQWDCLFLTENPERLVAHCEMGQIRTVALARYDDLKMFVRTTWSSLAVTVEYDARESTLSVFAVSLLLQLACKRLVLLNVIINKYFVTCCSKLPALASLTGVSEAEIAPDQLESLLHQSCASLQQLHIAYRY